MVFLGTLAQAQSKYEQAILKGKAMMGKTDSTEGYLAVANYFERIARRETGEWLPLYYKSLSLSFMATREGDKARKEETLDKALALVQQASKLDKNAETVGLEGFIQMLRLSADPAARGQTLSPVIFGLFQEALTIDPANPRALLFMGQMQHGTAQFFGSGFEEACGYIQRANDIFEQAPSQNTILPTWGKESAVAMLAICN